MRLPRATIITISNKFHPNTCERALKKNSRSKHQTPALWTSNRVSPLTRGLLASTRGWLTGNRIRTETIETLTSRRSSDSFHATSLINFYIYIYIYIYIYKSNAPSFLSGFRLTLALVHRSIVSQSDPIQYLGKYKFIPGHDDIRYSFFFDK